jgi:AcrR family transcriptional regulator
MYTLIMTTESPVELDPRAVRSRIAMLDAARTLLLTEGWDSVTHARVSVAAGVGRATAYRHWPTTTELALEAASLEAALSHPPHTGNLRIDVIAELKDLCEALTDRGLKPLMLLIAERATYDEEFQHIREELYRRGVGPLKALLRDAVRKGILSKNVNVDDLLSSLAGPIIYDIVLRDRPFGDRRVTAVVDLILQAHGYKDA